MLGESDLSNKTFYFWHVCFYHPGTRSMCKAKGYNTSFPFPLNLHPCNTPQCSKLPALCATVFLCWCTPPIALWNGDTLLLSCLSVRDCLPTSCLSAQDPASPQKYLFWYIHPFSLYLSEVESLHCCQTARTRLSSPPITLFAGMTTLVCI